ncbi:hypothetical protein E1I18_01900 [Mycoplasmopsis mucosicanis]|uniref:DivIVA domain-containing protein n=1 Tax=Mycoplasmopsis mucosicanis TaxID=458208 RepID=A0A507SKQ3_9BACT|nr:hypothetical protein [Mycoplasmopsis mucosicanis]TQC51526.1 hypothetical protein E1I18_01900 [Mycoplasmopsis mucosicanis]
MNNKEKLLTKFSKISREFNGYNVAQTYSFINELVNLIEELEAQNESLNKELKNHINEIKELKNIQSKTEFEKNIGK